MGGQAQGADVGNVGGLGFDGGWAFVIAAAGQAGEPFFAEKEAQGINADGLTGGRQFTLDVVDGEILFAHRHH